MKTFILFANLFLETTLAAVLLFYPQLFFTNLTPELVALIRILAATFTAIASVSILLWFNRENHKVWLNGFSVLAIFHGGMAVVQLTNSFQGLMPWPFFIIHAVLAVGCYVSADQECSLDELQRGVKPKKRK
jgi:hypothetical protein